MVRDPSIVSPTLTGVFIGGGHNKHGTGSRCTLQKQCRPPSPRRRWRCDRSSYKRSLFSRIRDGLAHYLTGPETAETPPSPSRIHVGSNHSGMGKPIVHCAFSHLRARWRGHDDLSLNPCVVAACRAWVAHGERHRCWLSRRIAVPMRVGTSPSRTHDSSPISL